MKFEYQRLANGLEVIGEPNHDAKSVAVGFFVRTGARDEAAEINGVSHFLEHMMFKGTPRRTSFDVNREFDEMGARYNAFTSEENTVFWGAVLPEYLPRLVDLLADMLRPSLRHEDFELEKKVILEEIGMYQDQPMWCAYEGIMREYFGGHALGNSVLGTTQSVGALSRDQMQAYFDDRYVTGNIVVGVAGNVDWPQFCRLIDEQCGGWRDGTASRSVEPSLGNRTLRVMTQPKIQQQHMLLMASAPPAESPQRFAADVLATAVGDGTGSRLFWELVDPGLAETAEIDFHEFNGTGTFMSYICCDPDNVNECLGRMRSIYRDVRTRNISEDELRQVKNKAASRIVLRSERPMGRLLPLGFNWIYRHEYRTVDDDLAALQAVTRDDLAAVLATHPLDRCAVVTVGPLNDEQFRARAAEHLPDDSNGD